MSRPTSVSGVSGDAGFAVAQGPDTERVFRAAMRHSRLVRFLRRAIPLFIVVAFGAAALVTWLNPLRMLAKLPIGELVVSGTTITMKAPRISGYTRDARPYELTARAAAQDVTRPNLVQLREVRAKVGLKDRSTVEFAVNNGTYDIRTELLTLGQDVVLTSSNGYEGRLSDVVVDVRKGSILTEKPVEVKMLRGTLNANRLEIAESGSLLRFDRGVAITFRLQPETTGSIRQADTP